jgi:DGQHR domain-containing protein
MTPLFTTGRELPVIKFSQPAGDFYLACMSASDVVRISYFKVRSYTTPNRPADGLNRPVSTDRVRKIAEYCQSADAAFPTAVILAVSSSDCELNAEENRVTITGTPPFAKVVDGQHRLQGLRASGATDTFSMPVVLLIDATEEQQALMFATINGTQTRVPPSLIYDLFEVTESRSPQKTSHEIARAMNESEESPWYRRLKMLGRKSVPDSLETVTQGTFVRELLPHLSKKPERDFDLARRSKPFKPDPACVFRKYFLANEDSSILKVMLNLFDAQRHTWPTEWARPEDSILTKSTGFMATMWALDSIVTTGQERHDLSQDYFRAVFERAKYILERKELRLTNESFPSSRPGIDKLSEVLRGGAESLDGFQAKDPAR